MGAPPHLLGLDPHSGALLQWDEVGPPRLAPHAAGSSRGGPPNAPLHRGDGGLASVCPPRQMQPALTLELRRTVAELRR